MEDGRIHNSGTKGNKGGYWPSIDRERWTNLKNEAVRLAFEALTGDDKEFKQKVILKMLDKVVDQGEIAGNLQLIVKRYEDGNNDNQSSTVAETGVGEPSQV